MRIGATAEQMLTEEALIELPVNRQQAGADEWYVCPALKAFAVSVDAVMHHVASVHLLLLVYLPEDDFSSTGGADKVIIIDLSELLLRENELPGDIGGEPLPEDAVWRMTAQHVVHR